MTRRTVSDDVLRANPAIAKELVAGEWESEPETRQNNGKSKDKKPLWYDAWRKHGIPGIVWVGEGERSSEFRPIPGRRHQVDAAIPEWKIAVEVDGGNRMVRKGRAVGRHTQDDDYWKINELSALGWTVFRFTTSQLKKEDSTCVEQVVRYMKMRGFA